MRRCKQCDRDISHRAPQARNCDDAACVKERALAAGRISWLKTGEKQRAKRRAQYADKKAQQPTVYIPCQVCGTEIVRKTVRTKWCSESCRTKARHAADPDRARLKAAQWRAANPERNRELLERWRSENRDRYLEQSRRASRNRQIWKAATGDGISLRAWLRLIRRHHGCCAYCGEQPPAGKPLQPDHVIPLARGGCHAEGNILPACSPCNLRKSDRFIMEVRSGRRVR